ncbi:MAG: sigma-70 family RNA polymerase sigma factor [Defluviitaleaceae bacterium]|nr:sigma-70 family RNA polymerase sigma factor [Defluviitaleaceae bacterium]
MAAINLKDFYPWYTHDEFIEVSEETAEELFVDKRYQKSHEQRIRRNMAFYSLDAQDGIEASAIISHTDNPEYIFTMMEKHCRLCQALNSLPEVQGRRIDARYLQGKSIQDIAVSEGVSESSVKESIDRGLKAMKKYFSNNFQNCPAICHQSEAGI